MPSLADAVAQCAAANVPVLFLDTCGILDVIRAPIRQRKISGCVEGATELLAGATATPPTCALVVGSLVSGEWNDNCATVVAETENHLKRMTEDAVLFHALSAHLKLPVAFAQPNYATTGFVSLLRATSERLLTVSVRLDSDQDAVLRAATRTRTKRAPSHKGGEFKDCVIFEECLEVARQLRAVGFTKALVFCTSNVRDYGSEEGKAHADIANDCNAVGVKLVTNLSWALSALRSP